MSKNPRPTIATDGYRKTTVLREGYVRKGGSNSPVSQIQQRPPAPAPMKPAVPREAGTSKTK